MTASPYSKLSTEERARRANEAEHRSAGWLAKGNELSESGHREKAEAAYDKSTFWLTRANALRGW